MIAKSEIMLSVSPAAYMIAIAASTGGPRALQTILSALPASLPVPVLIAQHLPAPFMPGLAQWLDAHTPLRVCVAEEGMPLLPGTVLLAPGTHHLTVRRSGAGVRVALQPTAQVDRHCPSADALFYTVAETYRAAALGIVLTGLGEDGAAGLLALREVGAQTLAQDEGSSTVYGMPRAALACGAALAAKPLRQIASVIANSL